MSMSNPEYSPDSTLRGQKPDITQPSVAQYPSHFDIEYGIVNSAVQDSGLHAFELHAHHPTDLCT